MKSLVKKVLFTLLLLNAVCYAAQVKTAIIYFGKDKAYLAAGEAQKLADLKLADYVLLKGHADNDGSEAYNIELSKKRVDAIKAFIQNIDKGIKIETNYYGDKQPVNKNADEKEKTLNRRVEITYISDPMLRITVPAQQFVIDNSKDQVITCKEGTVVQIPAGTFNNLKVNISITEHYQPDEIFAANLTTRCDKKPIETAGMINITAEADGMPVQPSKAITYKFPRGNKTKDFKVFNGVRDGANNINWVLPKVAKPEPKNNEIAKCNLPPDGGVVEMAKFVIDDENIFYSGEYTVNPSDSLVIKFFNNLTTVDRTLYNGCLNKTIVDIAVNQNGRITSVKDNYANHNSDCDLQVQRYIWACLPEKFSPYNTDAYIHLDFGTQVLAQVPVNAIPAPVAANNGIAMINDNNLFMALADAKYEEDKIVLTSDKLGWINCDRFYGAKLANFSVQADTGATVRLVVKKYKSFFVNEYYNEEERNANNSKSGTYTFYRIPDNEDAVLISTKKVNGVIYLAIADSKTANTTSKVNFNYKAVTPAELKEAMKKLKV